MSLALYSGRTCASHIVQVYSVCEEPENSTSTPTCVKLSACIVKLIAGEWNSATRVFCSGVLWLGFRHVGLQRQTRWEFREVGEGGVGLKKEGELR